MKQELLGLIEKKDLIRALAREDSGNGLIPISFKIYDVPEFVEWKEKIRAELVNIPNQNDTVAQAIDVIDRSFNGWHDEQSFDLLCGKLLAIKSSIIPIITEECIVCLQTLTILFLLSMDTIQVDEMK